MTEDKPERIKTPYGVDFVRLKGKTKDKPLSEKKKVRVFGDHFEYEDVKEAVEELKQKQKNIMRLYDNHDINWSKFVTKMIELPNKIFGEFK